MSEHNYLYLIWKDPRSRRNYTVGKLERTESGYLFEYCGEYEEARKLGWNLIQAFPEVKKYESRELFPAFAGRLPDKKRKNIADILKKYGLTSYDGYELLKQSGGRLPIDTFEFIDPIFDEDETIEKIFYIEGVRHLSTCKGVACCNGPKLHKGMNLVLKMEPQNQYDRYAIQVHTEMGEPAGYVPRYYSQSVSGRLNRGMSYDCIVLEVENNDSCQECVKVRLLMPKNEITTKIR